MLNYDDAKTFMTVNKGQEIAVELTDGTEVTGAAVSLNSKGINIRATGLKSIKLDRVVALICPDSPNAGMKSLRDDELTADDIADGIAEIEADDAWMDEDTEADYIADMKESGEVDLTDIDTDDTNATFTTAEVAARFAMTAKELRVQLRAWGMGVGQGRTYGLTSADLVTIQTKLAEKAEQA
jgi:hypothetical protein